MSPPRRVLVTGATSGIGAAAVRALRERDGVEVLVHGRDPARGAELVADLLSFAQTRALARDAGPIDVLVNNAGAVFAEHALTEDGHERTWQLNHLAGVLLADLTNAPRVINVASAAHRRARIDWDDPDALSGWPAYKQSKLANVLHARALPNAVALDPGVVDTRFAHALPHDDPLRKRLLSQRRTDPAIPGETLAKLALNELDPAPGAYVGAGGGAGKLDPAARDDEAARRLYDLSLRASRAR